MITATVKGLSKLQRALKVETARQNKNLETSIRVEGFRLRKEIIREMRDGAPGGRRFSPLSFIARRNPRRFRKNNPLTAKTDPWGIGHGGYSMANATRYGVASKSPFVVKVGWTDADVTGQYKLSKSWKRLATIHQEGFSRAISSAQRRYFMRRGAALKADKKTSKYAKYFFLKKTTKRLKTPARPVIEPFWKAHANEAFRNIRSNFKRKMKGERI